MSHSTLDLTLLSEQQIRFSASEGAPASFSELANFWNAFSTEGLRARTLPLTVPIGSFLAHRDWLRHNWVTRGHSITYSDELLSALRTTAKQVERFQARLELPIDEEPDWSMLSLNRALTDHQRENVKRLLAMDHGANFSVPGAGKTATTLVVWDYLRRLGSVDRLLVLCPRSAFESWMTEPEVVLGRSVISLQFSSAPIPQETEILFVNYEQLENEARRLRIERWAKANRVMLAIDEAHRIKGGAQSVRWRAVDQIAVQAARVDILSGTPMPQSFSDLRNLYSLTWRAVPFATMPDALFARMKRGSIFVRTTKNELNLPPCNIVPITVSPSALQVQIYSALKKKYIGALGMSDNSEQYFNSRGRAAFSLLAAASNPGLLISKEFEGAILGLRWPPREVASDSDIMDVLREYSSHEIPSKFQWAAKKAHEISNSGEKVIIWSSFVGNLIALEKLLAPLKPQVIHGGVSYSEREDRIRRFRENPTSSVLLTNAQTLGEGVSLHHECHNAIYIDRTYNAGAYLQSLDRIHRLGLPKNQLTNVWILKTEGTIDDRIAVRLETKIATLGRAMDDAGLVPMSLPDDDVEEFLSLLDLDSDDLDDILVHLSDA